MSLKPFLPQTEEHHQINDLPWNDLIDHIMPTLKPNSWKVLCFILRKTLGWNKEADKLSYSQIMDAISNQTTSRQTVSVALEELIEGGYILAINEAGKEKTILSYAPNPGYEIQTGTILVPDEKETGTKIVIDEIQTGTILVPDEQKTGQSGTKIVHTKDHVLHGKVPPFEILYQRWLDNLSELDPRLVEMLGDYYDEHPDWVSEIIDIVIGSKPDKPWQYFVKIINKWVKSGKPVELPEAPRQNSPPASLPIRNGSKAPPIDAELLEQLQAGKQ